MNNTTKYSSFVSHTERQRPVIATPSPKGSIDNITKDSTPKEIAKIVSLKLKELMEEQLKATPVYTRHNP